MVKKTLIVLILLLIGVVGYRAFTKYYIPKLVVSSLTKNDSTNFLLPKSIKRKINKGKKNVVPLTDSLVYIAHRQNITIEDILREIDKLEEDEVNWFHDELKSRRIKNADELFDFAKSSFNPAFDVESFRPIFKDNFTFSKYQELLEKSSKARENLLYDFDVAKLIAKQLVLDREEKFNSHFKNK